MSKPLYKEKFRDWTIPGPIAPGSLGNGPEPEEGETLDAISGHFRLFQLKKGHRFSTDDLLTAWYATSWCPCAETALDLGSGIGTVATVMTWRLPGLRLVTVEAQEESLRLAMKSVHWNGTQDRVDLRQGDFRDEGVISTEEKFDLVTGSPPYFPTGSGLEGDHPQKVACRFELRGDVSDYCTTAIKHMKPGGTFAIVFPITPGEQHDRVKQAATNAGLSIIRMRPIIFRETERPLIGVFIMMRSEDLPESSRSTCWEEPPLTIRDKEGQIHPEYAAVKLSFGFPP
ncbi:methyltransferase [Verrucomicrobia bacterium]|nr:methyltransferase [Verrucomicrobiota bacterium]